MDKPTESSGIDDALRDLAQERDRVLGKAPSLSPAREEVLKAALAGQFPLDTALHEVATERDQLLELNPAALPARAEAALRGQLVAGGPSYGETNTSVWPSFFRWPLRAVLTASALIAVAIICFDGWETPSHRSARNLPDTPPTEPLNMDAPVKLDRSPLGKAELFARKVAIAQFSLSTTEPASLQASFLADGNQAFPGLRLDLPARLTLMEDDLSRIP